MCLEDLRLGKGRYPKNAANGGYGNANLPLLGANNKRVAVIISSNGTVVDAGQPQGYAKLKFDSVPGPLPSILHKITDPPLVLTIETYGSMVTSTITGDTSELGEGSYIYAQGIYTDVEATPISQSDPPR